MARDVQKRLVKACLASASLFATSSCSPAANPEEIDWVPLSGACFTMGEDEAYREEGPEHRTCVAPFELSRTEITNAQFAIFVDETGYKTGAEKEWIGPGHDGLDTTLPPGSAVFSPPQRANWQTLNWWSFVEGANWRQPQGPERSAPEAQAPVVHVTRADAEAFAKWAGGRLPTEAEWEYAARGGLDGALMAWPEAEAVARIDKANTWQGVFPIVDTGDDGAKGITRVASYPPNGFGLYDMIGNVWEWTSTPYSPDHSEEARSIAGSAGFDPAQPNVAVGTLKGGSYLCATSYCFRFRSAARQAQDLGFGTSHIGFRIAKDGPVPERTG